MRKDNGMSIHKKRFAAVAKYLPLAVGAILIIIAVYLAIVTNIELTVARECGEFHEIEDYTVVEREAENTPLGIVQEYRMTINDFPGENTPHLAFYARHQYVRVWIGDELVYTLMPSDENGIGKTVGVNWVMVHLQNHDLGKEVLVEITPVYASHSDRIPEFYIGSELGVYRNQLAEDLPQIFLAVAAIIIGIVFAIFGIWGLLRKKGEPRTHGLVPLGIFAIIMGVWRLTDIRYAAFVLPDKPILLAYLSIATLMLAMIPLCLYAARNDKHRFLPYGYSIATSLVCLVQIVLQLLGVKDFRETLTLSHVMIVLGIVCIVANVVMNYRYHKKDTEKGIVDRFLPFIFTVGVAIDVVIYFAADSSHNLLFTILSIVIYVGVSGGRTIYRSLQHEKQLAQKEVELTEARVAVSMSQIQPHFLYNALNSIAELCVQDPMKAREATVDFAEYLRVNLKAIQQKALVPFMDEFVHIRRYLDLEKMRFDERLNVIFDIRATEFILPQLSLQPIVENAVKHGVGEKEEGGTVIVSTREESNCFLITIEDDGVGFDVEAVKNDGKVHIGLENSRNRLQTLCGGTLEIESKIGEGTTATIRIPKEKRV